MSLLSAATGLHKGGRAYQQDQVLVLPHPKVKPCVLAIVADGMGGRSGGRKASDQVILTAEQMFKRFSPNEETPQQLFEQLLQQAHMAIQITAAASEEEPHSTLAAAIVDLDHVAHWVHCGDSRIYHFFEDQLIYRTQDHSYVQTLVDAGKLTEEEARNHPQSNILLHCLGLKTPPEASFHSTEMLGPGHAIMVCSDGIWHLFKTEELGRVIHQLEPRAASEYLIAKARERGGKHADNMSLAILKWH